MSYTESTYNRCAFDAGGPLIGSTIPKESLNEEGKRYRGSRLVEGLESTAKGLYENSASVRLAAQGLSKVGQGLNWLAEPLIQASEQNETAPIYPGATIEGRSPNALLGDVIKGTGDFINFTGQGAQNLGDKINLDPRISQAIGKGAAEELLTVGAGKLIKGAKNLNLNTPQNAYATSTVGRYNALAFDNGSNVQVSNVFASSNTVLPPKTYQGRTQKWNKWIEKFGGEKGAKQASDIQNEALKFWDVQKQTTGKGNLKDFGTLREIDGKQYYIKNKANSLKEPNFNFDSLEKTVAGRIMRESTAKVDVKDVQEAVKRINKNRQLTGEPPITIQQTTDYLNAQRKNKRDLQKLIKNLNYDEGKGTWSLGHIEAVEAHTKKGKKGADMITNLELEPFRDMFDSKTGRWIQGNASRSNKDELTDLLLQAINKAETLDEDIVKFLDPVVGGYWPRKGKVTNQKTWMKEQIKLEKYLESVKKKGADKTLQESGVMDTSIYEGTKLPNLSR